MAKIHQNAHKFPIQWNGDITQVGKDQQNDNIPSNVSLIFVLYNVIFCILVSLHSFNINSQLVKIEWLRLTFINVAL